MAPWRATSKRGRSPLVLIGQASSRSTIDAIHRHRLNRRHPDLRQRGFNFATHDPKVGRGQVSGGFTHACDPEMEDFILAQSPQARPRIGFIGTASHDDVTKIARFHARFAEICDQHTHLPMQADAAQAMAWVESLDIVYVGGGNTLHLLQHWLRTGIDQVMISAARRGVLMAGISAGASVWFDQALSDAGGQGLAPLAGIGLMAGSCCPHYSSEPHRQPAFTACIARGELPDGIAIDDGVAVLIDASGPRMAFSARSGAGAYQVRRSGNVAVVQCIAASTS